MDNIKRSLVHNFDDELQRAPSPAEVVASQAALHLAQLALARWVGGKTYAEMQVSAALRPSSQARWYDQANSDFRAWREGGGFGHDDRARPTRLDDIPGDPAPQFAEMRWSSATSKALANTDRELMDMS